MKKLAVALFVALLGFVFTAPAFALENQFGGYWRVRMYHQSDFNGMDNGAADAQLADTRTRLYYTAVLNDNLKFVNKFEMDAVWGNGSYGELGSDGISVEVKHSYIDFNLGPYNFKVGTQGNVIQRGFVFDDDFSGIAGTVGDFGFMYAKIKENGQDVSADDQLYNLNYTVNINRVKIVPNVTYMNLAADEYLYYAGLDVDGQMGGYNYWVSLIYNGGELANDVDVKAFLIALGGDVTVSDMLGVHFQTFYATGDDDPADKDMEAYQTGNGHSYYWAEIMGLGTFDNQASANSPGDQISNIWAVNLGVTYQVNEKLSFGGDLWYATLVEENAADEKYLGTELDLTASYEVIEGLNLDLVAAYLFKGDATYGGSDDANPYELGSQFSISF
ncbi:MAG: hypothetical protein CSA29_05765 [Desulfobacterales bacterium]|nr:MAG: hypothetical protein CSA29_05765 [Desulfobacterales bacterium]